MERLTSATTLFFLLLLICLHVSSSDENVESQIITANNQFSNDMYKSLSKNITENIFFSPLSAHECLSMLYQGSGGTTKEALSKTLRISDPSSAAEGYNSIMNNLNSIQNITSTIANKIYIKNGYHWNTNFEESVSSKFQAEAETVELSNGVVAARTINTWVKNKTKGKIEKLFEEGDFDQDTRAVLVNAIYFKGIWANKFSEEDTQNKEFYINGENSVSIPMLSTTAAFNYKEDSELNAKVLEMPYTNNRFSMVVILPNEKDGINELTDKLSNFELNKLTEGMVNDHVVVQIPKFKIETTINLKETLTDMGLGEIFGSRCDLSGMIQETTSLYVSRAIQKAYIEVNEEGAEAAAATGLIVSEKSLRIYRNRFTADHPFVYMIISRQFAQPSILFYGLMRNPVQTS